MWLVRLLRTTILLLLALVVLAGLGIGGLWLYYGRELPDHRQLASYAPPTLTRIHAGDGRVLAEYARERRVFVPVGAIPDQVKQAFIAAEDQNFYRHRGIDPLGILRTAIANIERLRADRRPAGASTITQQVAKNFLLSNELSLTRKIKEAILAIRMERAFTKDEILELYLNQIFLGGRSFGVAAAALNYFDKALDDLTIGEAAVLAGLPQAPSRYDPTRNLAAATARRDYVIGRMQEDGHISAAEAALAKSETLTVRRTSGSAYAEAPFFVEEVRRQLVQRYGEEGFYEGGLSVRTTLRPELQALADRELRRGLATYDRKRGWRGAWSRLELGEGGDGWAERLRGLDPGFELGTWRRAVVLEARGRRAVLGLDDAARVELPADEVAWAQAGQRLAAGDVVLVEAVERAEGGSAWVLRQRPEVEGAVVVLDPHTGRTLALSGGFSFRQSKFNRATQAKRQPGSAFKPFVYLAALEGGYTPASIVDDAPIALPQGPGLPLWQPENFSQRFYGPSTLRLGIEKSRNLMTVRLAQAVGMPKITEVAHRFGIDEGLGPFLAASLGANEVTLQRLSTAYAMLVNGGKRVEPYLVERIQDRRGSTIMRRDERPCVGCQDLVWDGSAPPIVPDAREQVVDPRLAYQMVSMLEGVVERGTAAAASRLNRPLAGKTGTTNEAKDGWFVGFSPDLVVGVFIGYDQPASLGDRETGASVALPVWTEIVAGALEGQPPIPFRTPPGLSLVRIDAATGQLPGGSTRSVIAEAFLPGTEPVRRSATGPSVFRRLLTPDADGRRTGGGGSGAGGIY